MTRFRFPYILTLSLSTLAFGAVGCSNGSSPTEPAFDDLSAPVAVTSSSSVASTGEKRHGADDPAGDDRGGQRGGGGADDPAGDDRGGRRGGRGGRGGNDDPRQPRQPRPNAGAEFEGTVLSVNGNTVILAGGTRVIVNGQTQWIARGDLRNLNQVSSAVAANRPVRAEGRGIRQGNGNFVAQTIKVEVDD
ncbi:MAG TPA: hypothetical protein VKK31_12425 [Thermoanaerobaculia bacterium]|nr:hypothetical protein [Thermoanaerobaculia bacterium]